MGTGTCTVSLAAVFIFLFVVQVAYGQGSKEKNKNDINIAQATLQDSLAIYNNAKSVQDFYEKSGQYIKTSESRIKSDDLDKIHAGNDKKYEEVLRTINNERYTPQGKRKIRPEEYRVNIDRYKYKQRELSDYVLNTDAPMQLFDRRIAPQLLVDYTMSGNPLNPINDDDVDFKMYDPIAVKPYSMLTPDEKTSRAAKYPAIVQSDTKPAPAPMEKVVKDKAPQKAPEKVVTSKAPQQTNEKAAETDFIIAGPVPDSVRFKRFKSKKEAEEYIKNLPVKGEGE